MRELQDSGFNQLLKAFALEGKPVYGGSAGAIVQGHDIRSASHFDRNVAGDMAFEGLDLAGGHTIWPHYTPQDDERIVAFVREYRETVLAISERSGVVVEAKGLRPVGFEPVYLFNHRGKIKMVGDNEQETNKLFGV